MKTRIAKAAAIFGMTLAMATSTFAQAGTWQFNGSTYKCITVDGSIIHDAFTDDGYWVDHNGDWVQSTIPRDIVKTKSANGKRVIAVSKSAHVVELWQNGECIKSYKCSTGKADGDKESESDGKTPVGEFYVCLMNDHSAYTKGIGVSYPMTEDAERGLKAGLITQDQYNSIVTTVKQKGKPDWYTNLGGEIELHGGSDVVGGNASRGCIVLSNADILDLYSRVAYGDTILIYE